MTTMTTTLTAASTLISAGVRFSIRDRETTVLDATTASLAQLRGSHGELPGLREERNLDYRAFESESSDDTNKVDTGELLDDLDRWGHLADAHTGAKREVVRTFFTLPVGEKEDADFRHEQMVRRERMLDLHRWANRMAARIASAKRRGHGRRAGALQLKVRNARWLLVLRYNSKVMEIVAEDRGRWHTSYLTKAQKSELYAAFTAASHGRKTPTPEPERRPERSIEVLPPGGWEAVLAMALLTA